MKLTTQLKSLAGAALLVAASSCDSFLDVNQSPNLVLEPPVANIMASATTGVGFTAGSDIHRFTSIWMQQFAGQGGSGVQTRDYDRYILTETDVNNVWRGAFYSRDLSDLQQIIIRTEVTSPYYAGIARILQAYLFSVAVQGWGDIPYSEALQYTDNLQPRYDPSQQVYEGLLAQIDRGITELNAEASVLTPGADDLVYGGNRNRWIAMANTLKMRLFCHYLGRDNLRPTGLAGIAALLTAPQIDANAGNFQVAFQAGDNNRANPIHQFELRRADQFFPSATLVNRMNTREDPRRQFYFSTFNGNFVGAVNTAPGVSINFSRIGVYLRGARTGTGLNDYDGSAPMRMLTLAEKHFILAEYHLRAGNAGAADASFKAGITASMDNAGVAMGARNAYIAEHGTLPADATAALERIMDEKFVANYGVPMEPWNDWRRTGFPNIQIVANPGNNPAGIPRILPYSDLERVANRANTPLRPDLTQPTVFFDRNRQ